MLMNIIQLKSVVDELMIKTHVLIFFNLIFYFLCYIAIKYIINDTT